MSPSENTIEQTLGLNTPKKSPLKKYLLWGGFGAIIIMSLWWWSKHSDEGKVHYQTTTAETKTLMTTVSATGNLEPTNTIDVGIEVSGTITEVLVDYNDKVKTGQLMARLDTTKLNSKVTSSQAALARFKANISSAKASLSNAKNEWERVHKMYSSTGGNYPAKQVLDEADNALLSARAALDAAIAQSAQSEAELQANQDDLRKAIVVSPIDGIVLERKIEPGQTVVASMQTPILFKMAKNLSTMQVIVSVDEADIGEVREKQKVTFNVDAYPNRKFHGVITQLRLNSQIVNGVVTYDALVEVPNEDLQLRPGMTATAQIITGVLPQVLTIPNAALRFTPPKEKDTPDKEPKAKAVAGSTLWVLRNNEPQQIEITAGKSDGIVTAIKSSSLRADDKIIIGIEEEL